jgi:hypothetical protein
LYQTVSREPSAALSPPLPPRRTSTPSTSLGNGGNTTGEWLTIRTMPPPSIPISHRPRRGRRQLGGRLEEDVRSKTARARRGEGHTPGCQRVQWRRQQVPSVHPAARSCWCCTRALRRTRSEEHSAIHAVSCAQPGMLGVHTLVGKEWREGVAEKTTPHERQWHLYVLVWTSSTT